MPELVVEQHHLARLDRQGDGTTALDTGHVLVAGGYNASAEVHDPETGIWRGAGAAPHAYREASATRLLDGRVLVTGGTDSVGARLSSAEVFDVASGT
ncbi:MAG TPA: hypothetical protein VFZ09_06430 [Archangium sp.]|uniref:hypothetical protein n=1 Tax=Archangium sp. TaxID=1872627 RepID=UPI002E3635CD|nr:hypothetical protein [Archangium sp.]HEX5745860.1 hypothetical protein [Archangium sp.]